MAGWLLVGGGLGGWQEAGRQAAGVFVERVLSSGEVVDNNKKEEEGEENSEE